MSQYEHKLDDNLTVRFGWDPPLQTFFFQLKDEAVSEDSEDPMLLWRGTKPREIYEVEDLMNATPSAYKPLVRARSSDLFGDKDENR